MSYSCKLAPTLYSKETKTRQREEWMNQWINEWIHLVPRFEECSSSSVVILSSSFCEHRVHTMPLERLSAFQLCLGWVLHLGMSNCFLSVTLHIIPLILKFTFLQKNHLTNVCLGVHFHLFFLDFQTTILTHSKINKNLL
jgi:hypothetical protein